MMADKREEEERLQTAECQRLQMEIEANKEREENERRELDELLQLRGEAMKEGKRRRTFAILAKKTKRDPAAQSTKTKDPDTSSTKEVPVQRKKSWNSTAPTQAFPSPKKTEGMPSGYNVMRRRWSSKRLGNESFTGTRVIHFTIRRKHIVHCGKCLGQGSSGSKVYSGIVVVCEWILSSLHAGPQMRRTLSITENQQQDPQARLMKQVFSIKQETLSLIKRLSHPNLTHYLAVNVQEESPTVKVQVLSEYVGGGDLSLHLRKGGMPVAQLREYTQQLVEALCYLHSKSVVHKDLRLSSCRLDSDGYIRLADYSVGKRLSDLYQMYGGNVTETQSNAADGNKKINSGCRKKGDVYNLGLLVLSLAVGDVIFGDVKEISPSLPSDLRDFLFYCLKTVKRDRWSASQLREHSFLTSVMYGSLANGQQEVAKNNGKAGNDGPSYLVDQPEREEPLPCFLFISGVPGKSRVECEFEKLQFLGRGGFGSVIKVRNKLDNCSYAVKRIPLNPKSTQLNKTIIREVQLISRLNHENVVRYYSSWIEIAEDVEDSWWQDDEKGDNKGFKGNIEVSVLQSGDLLDTESEGSDEGVERQETGNESSAEYVRLQYLYIQMEYCEKSTLRNLIDEGLHGDKERIWRLFREIVEGLVHIHSQGIIHRDLKPVNLFLDFRGRIKIGDFGLATTHGVTRGGMGTDNPDSIASGQSPKMNSSSKESMTGEVGSTLYAAPELKKRSGGRVKYSQKVDLYSLGIIFFEMCYKPFKTSMERVKVLGNLRTEGIIFPTDFDHEGLAKETIFLKLLLKHAPEERPTSQELLQNPYVPPKTRDSQLDEVLKHTLAVRTLLATSVW
ncbi:unnamed protein product [Pocillopora meandrina]|uniref:Protein kinase domain-containing protein n=1 Tax=Pocillopora meandrina TaxID=46732 RepID=A0AAU9XXP6_9CNID|nr:unnamed protein product [Pocillopora meandrina]